MGLLSATNNNYHLIQTQNKAECDLMNLQNQTQVEQDALAQVNLDKANVDKEDQSVLNQRAASLQQLDGQINTIIQERKQTDDSATEARNGATKQYISQGSRDIFGVGGQQ